ncbi:MAG: NAD(+) synthase [Treponema sp.]|jgi:NAD+ synthase|nr:NAD(+) synthase [Treponema sp.]
MFEAGKVKDGIVQWIQNYFNKNGRDCLAIIGISGGKDSSITAALCTKALGADRVFGVLMPQGEQADIGVSLELVNHLGISHCVINIGNCVDSLLGAVKEGEITINRQASVNIPARIRMTALYAVSATVNGRVANTCNLSEDWVGYSTKFGDSAGDFSPLSRMTVTEIKAIGRELKLPPKFIDKTPEDGLSGMTDEENLGFSYAVLDKYIRDGICDDPVIKDKIDRLHKNNLHKQELMPCYEFIGI